MADAINHPSYYTQGHLFEGVNATKRCSRCKRRKPLSQFYNCKSGKLGKGHRCIACTKLYHQRFTPEQQTKRHATSARWYNEHRAKVLPRMRANSLKRNYNISVDEYEALIMQQGNRCAICGTDKPGRKRQQYFSVDHDHATNKRRGLLCDQCNKGLGHFGDNIAKLEAAIQYLIKYGHGRSS